MARVEPERDLVLPKTIEAVKDIDSFLNQPNINMTLPWIYGIYKAMVGSTSRSVDPEWDLELEKTTEEMATKDLDVFLKQPNINMAIPWIYGIYKAVAKGGGSSSQPVNNGIVVEDTQDSKNYNIVVNNGVLKPIETTDEATADGFVIKDATTGDNYYVFVENGEIKKEITSETDSKDQILFKDQTTNETIKVYISDGDLKTEQVFIQGDTIINNNGIEIEDLT